MYDSPTCGHSWISMSQPCGFLQDLLNCPVRQVYQTLIAPPYTCPTCNLGFADAETIQMIQGPWGCNQMIRNHIGGSHSIPGSWGNVRFTGPLGFSRWRGPAVTSAAIQPLAMVPYDHRLTGPYGHHPIVAHNQVVVERPLIANAPMICDGYDAPLVVRNGPVITNTPMAYDDWDDCYSSDYYYAEHRPRRRRHRRYRYYEYSSTPDVLCSVM